MAVATDYGHMMSRSKILNGYFFKTYEKFSFWQKKKWLINAKSLTVTKLEKIVLLKYPKYLTIYLVDLPKSAKTFGILLKKSSHCASVVCCSSHLQFLSCANKLRKCYNQQLIVSSSLFLLFAVAVFFMIYFELEGTISFSKGKFVFCNYTTPLV